MIQQFSRVIWTVLLLVLWNSGGMAQTPYYSGKTITIIAGTKAGDVYDRRQMLKLFAK